MWVGIVPEIRIDASVVGIDVFALTATAPLRQWSTVKNSNLAGNLRNELGLVPAQFGTKDRIRLLVECQSTWVLQNSSASSPRANARSIALRMAATLRRTPNDARLRTNMVRLSARSDFPAGNGQGLAPARSPASVLRTTLTRVSPEALLDKAVHASDAGMANTVASRVHRTISR